MAIITYNGTNYDTHLGHGTITATNVTVTTSGITSATTTAPNTSNKATGIWIFVAAVPSSSNNYTVTLQESTVDKVSAVMLSADIRAGFNYVRFTTPYQFTTTSAGAYRVKVSSSSTNSGSLKTAASGLWYAITYDSAVSFTSGDNIYNGGWHNTGLTPKTLTLTGTIGTIGDGTDKTIISSSGQTSGAAITVGCGGTIELDPANDTTLTVRGSIVPTAGGVFRSKPSSISIDHTIIFDNETTAGDYGIATLSGSVAGYYDIEGTSRGVVTTTFASGLGTVVSPLITQTACDFQVGDEIVVAGNDYLKNEKKFVITRNSSTSFVLADTSGGAASALTHPHTAGAHISNLTRNVIIKPLNTARGYWIYNVAYGQGFTCKLNNTRCEYPNAASGDGLILVQNSVSGDALGQINGLVVFGNTSNRDVIQISSIKTPLTHSDIITYATNSSNGAGTSALRLSGSANQTIQRYISYSDSSGNGGPLFSITGSAAANTLDDCHFYGGNAGGSANNSAWYIAASGNTFNSCSINGSRVRAIYLIGAVENTWNSCDFGTIGTNTIDVDITADTLNTALFQDCSFGSATLIANYLTGLEGSDIAFQNMDGDSNKHRWYTNHGSAWSSGAGQTDTTVRTASSLSLAIKPEDATNGFQTYLKIPANPTAQSGISGYMYRNATFSSGTLKVELFLPGTLLTDTPDASYIFPTTTGSWLPFNISAYYSSSAARYATVKITAVTATSGAYAFLDDLYDVGTSNKVAGLDLWDEGHISPIMVQYDFSVVPSAVWGYSKNNTTPDTMGRIQSDSNLTNLLAADKLS